MAGKYLRLQFSVVSYKTQFVLPSHLLRTSYMKLFRIQCNFISFKYTPLLFFIFSFIFISFLFCILIFYYFFFVFPDVPKCSGMFRNVPCSEFYRRPKIGRKFWRKFEVHQTKVNDTQAKLKKNVYGFMMLEESSTNPD